jgi:hypothetical protein
MFKIRPEIRQIFDKPLVIYHPSGRAPQLRWCARTLAPLRSLDATARHGNDNCDQPYVSEPVAENHCRPMTYLPSTAYFRLRLGCSRGTCDMGRNFAIEIASPTLILGA